MILVLPTEIVDGDVLSINPVSLILKSFAVDKYTINDMVAMSFRYHLDTALGD